MTKTHLSDEVVERVAAALAGSDDMLWDTCSKDSRRVYRRYASAALEAARYGELVEAVQSQSEVLEQVIELIQLHGLPTEFEMATAAIRQARALLSDIDHGNERR